MMWRRRLGPGENPRPAVRHVEPRFGGEQPGVDVAGVVAGREDEQEIGVGTRHLAEPGPVLGTAAADRHEHDPRPVRAGIRYDPSEASGPLEAETVGQDPRRRRLAGEDRGERGAVPARKEGAAVLVEGEGQHLAVDPVEAAEPAVGPTDEMRRDLGQQTTDPGSDQRHDRSGGRAARGWWRIRRDPDAHGPTGRNESLEEALEPFHHEPPAAREPAGGVGAEGGHGRLRGGVMLDDHAPQHPAGIHRSADEQPIVPCPLEFERVVAPTVVGGAREAQTGSGRHQERRGGADRPRHLGQERRHEGGRLGRGGEGREQNERRRTPTRRGGHARAPAVGTGASPATDRPVRRARRGLDGGRPDPIMLRLGEDVA
jgi:hypothetical protein